MRSWRVRGETERRGSGLRRGAFATFVFVFLIFVVVAVTVVVVIMVMVMIVNEHSMTMMSVPEEWRFQRIVAFVVVGVVGMEGLIPLLVVAIL